MKATLALGIAALLCGTMPPKTPRRAQANLASQHSATEPSLRSALGGIAARKKALLDDSNDLAQTAGLLRGTDADAALGIAREADSAVAELDATQWFIAVYVNMECEHDQEVARAALRNRLALYSRLLDAEGGQTDKYMAILTRPAASNEARSVRDDLRMAKELLDGVAATVR